MNHLKFHKFFNYIYYTLVLNLLWVASVIGSLGLLFIPANISMFEVIQWLSSKQFEPNQKLFKRYFESLQQNVKAYYKLSLIALVLIILVLFSIMNLYGIYTFLGTFFYYVSLLGLPFYLLSMVTISYFIAQFHYGSLKERVKSAIAFNLAYILELVIFHGLFGALAIVLFTLSPEGSLFLLVSLYFLSFYGALNLIREGWNIRYIIQQFTERGIRY